MIRCLIIDDEPHAIAKIEEYVCKTPFLKPEGSYTNALNAIHSMKSQPAELLFLDIQMPDISGMDILKMIGKDVMIILITGYNEYAVESFEYNAVDYLLKPVSYARFLKAAQKAYDLYLSKNHLNIINPQRDYIFIKGEHKGKQIKIDFNQLNYIEAEKNYATFHCEKERHMVVMTLKEAEAILPSELFVRIHHSFIVSLKKIITIEGNQVIIGCRNNERITIPVGSTYKNAFLNQIAK